MKRKLFLLTGIIFVLLSGCGKEKNSAVKDQFESGYMELFGISDQYCNFCCLAVCSLLRESSKLQSQ